ncbi:hypothetical protein SUGI_0550880 [Cryptomeria japonica]|nr:hypothetical protein SUGI_0550880 [Cryptomeria japonica]
MKSSGVEKYIGVFMLVCLLFGKAYATSAFIMFPQPGCSPCPVMIADQCGCTAVPNDYHGGWMFDYQGQVVALYNTANCDGLPHTVLGDTEKDCNPFDWISIRLICA